jgi:hypothetical protein
MPIGVVGLIYGGSDEDMCYVCRVMILVGGLWTWPLVLRIKRWKERSEGWA